MKVQSVKGFRDLLPEQTRGRRAIIEAAHGVLESYGYGEIELPILEKVELFARSVGSSSDIVEKEMYAFADRDREQTPVALRPEGTASVVRAYIETGMVRSHPEARLYYGGPMFRRERPQKGRYRQFHQIGAELFGRSDPGADAETLCLVADICLAVGVVGARIEINSLGDAACRPAYRESLHAYGKARIDQLCPDCRTRLERNPLRLLDCKQEGCKTAMAEAPLMIDALCDDCRQHHARVLEQVDAAGVAVAANPRMVRGLDYYCRTAFEIVAEGLGSQDAVGGGGRYDGLVEALGGPAVAGIGFAFGIERLEMAAAQDASALTVDADFFVAPVGDAAAATGLAVARRLRATGARVELESAARRLKVQMKRADKSGARYVVLLGEDELAAGRATVRDMRAKVDYPGLFALDAAGAAMVAAIEAAGADPAGGGGAGNGPHPG